jgi:integrase
MRGTIRRRGKTSWQIKFDAARIGGVRDTRYVTVRGTYKDAQRELTRLLAEADTGKLPEATKDTVAGYLRAHLDGLTSVAPKTLERYRELAEGQIIPHLGEAKIRYLTAVEVGAWHGALLREGLSPRTVRHAHRVLARALRRVKNTAALEVELPGVEEEEIEILTAEQISDVLAKLDGHTLFPIVSLALTTGMRRGELLGLQWGDIDLDAATLRVERSVEETKAGVRLKPPKTRRGRRNLKLPAEAVAMLRAHKVQQMELRLVLGMGNVAPSTLVFGTVGGELIRPRNLSKTWWRVRSAMGLPAVSLHAFRHTHASMLIRAGVDILTISRRLGHSKAAITLDVYGHLIDGADAAAAKALEGLL